MAAHTYFVSVLGQDKGYTVTNSPWPEGVFKSKRLYLTAYPASSHNRDCIYNNSNNQYEKNI